MLQQASLNKLNTMAHKLHSVNKLSQGSSLQVLQKDSEWKEIMNKVEAQHLAQQEEFQRLLDSSEREKASIKKNYDSQIKMLTEHLVDLQAQIKP